MKRVLFLLGIILGFNMLFASRISAQNQESTFTYPQTTLKVAKINLNNALKDGNAGVVLRSWMEIIAAQLQISQDSFPSLINQTEILIEKTKSVSEKAMLNSVVAEMYLTYFKQKRFFFDRRPPIRDKQPENISEWCTKDFSEAIYRHTTCSLESAEELQKIDINRFKAALIAGNSSLIFRPTLFDFLAYRAIDIYSKLDMSLDGLPWGVRSYTEKLPLSIDITSPLDEFLTIKFDPQPNHVEQNIFFVYQQLLQFHQANNNTAALIMSNINRIQAAGMQVSRLKEKVSKNTYIANFWKFYNAYKDNPYSVEILISRPFLTSGFEFALDGDPAGLRQLLNAYDYALAKFPDYERIGCLKEWKRHYTQPSLYVDQLSSNNQRQLQPGQKSTIKFLYNNIRQLSVTLQPINMTPKQLVNYSELPDSVLGAPKVKVNQTLNDTLSLVLKEGEITIPPLTPGFYALRFWADSITNPINAEVVYASSLFTSSQSNGASAMVIVTDGKTGKPIPNAKIETYTGYQNPSTVTYYHTDNQGRAFCSEGDYYSVSYRGNKWSALYAMNLYRNYQTSTPPEKAALFTDRSIYRPGQTVYFSGIYYSQDSENAHVLPGTFIDIDIYNTQNKSIFNTKITTDSLGVYSGSYTLPQTGMTGLYRIEVSAGYRKLSSTYVRVEEYKRPSFKVEFVPAGSYSFDAPVTVTGKASAYSGFPLGDATVKYTVVRQSHYLWRIPLASEEVADGEIKTNHEGRFTITFTPSRPVESGALQKKSIFQYRITATVTSTSGETQEGTTWISVSDMTTLIHLSQLTDVNRDKAQQPIVVTVTNPQGDTLRQSGSYSLSLLQDNTDISDIKPLDSLKIDKAVLTGRFISSDSIRIDWSKLPSGPYRFTAEVKDSANKAINQSQSFIIYSHNDKKPPVLSKFWFPQRTDRDLSLEMGGTTEIIFGSSYPNVYAFYELYSAKDLIEKKIIRLSNEVIRIPITYQPAYADNITVYLSFVKEFAIHSGSININKKNELNDLVIHAQSFRDKLTSGQEEEWTFTVKDKAGNPVSAGFMTTMFDASLNAIDRHNWSFYPHVYTPRYYGNWQQYTRQFPQLEWHDPNQKFNCEALDYDRFKINLLEEDQLEEVVVTGSPTQRKVSVVGAVTSVDANTLQAPSSKNILAGAVAGVITETASLNESSNNTWVRGIGTFGNNMDESRTEKPEIRKEMSETAFFYPKLVTNAKGEVSIRFKVPDSNTEWQFMALSFTKNLHYGMLNKTAISSKPFMVAPNLPRFVRQGDLVSISTLIVNQTDSEITANGYLELFDPATDSVLYRKDVSDFTVAGRATSTQNFSIAIPDNRDLIGIRIVAQADNFSDGEQHLLPILPSRTMVTETKPFVINKASTSTFTLKRLAKNKLSDTHNNYRLTLEYTANPTWLAVQSLPTLAPVSYGDNTLHILAAFYSATIAEGIISANPRIDSVLQVWNSENSNKETLLSALQQNEQLKSILLSETPWVMQATSATERMQGLSEVFDRTRLDQRQQDALFHLSTRQKRDGGWAWMKMMDSSSPYITLTVLEYMARLTQLGVIEYNQDAKEMQIRALNYIDNEFVKSVTGKNPLAVTLFNIKYLYVRTYFADVPISGSTLPLHRQLVDLLKSEWPKLDLREKAMATVIFHRLGFKEEAQKVLRSMTEHATRTAEMGMYWDNNRSNQWLQETGIAIHAYITMAYHEVMPDSPLIPEMKQWLLMQKQVQDWGSSTATADAVFALLATGPDWLSTGTEGSQLVWGNKPVDMTESDELTGYIQSVKDGKSITSADASVVVTTTKNQPSWGAIYWQYFENFEKIEQASSGVRVSKQLFVEKKTDAGSELVPLAQATAKPGDKIVVRLVVQCDRDMEYVHLKDQRAACFAPSNQTSNYQFKDGVAYYQENRDAFTNFFFNYLPKGEYVLSYDLWLDRTGIYHNGITTIQCLFAPQFSANSQGEVLKIK